jgi:myo-inositol-1(or 4)-monophosphatase
LNGCYVANGSGDIYFEYGLHIWDMAASCLIASEAGCVVMDPSGGELDLTKRRVLIAATNELAQQVIPLLTTVEYESD